VLRSRWPAGHSRRDVAENLRPDPSHFGAERVALNFVQRLSGVATLTAQFVEAVSGTPAQILDTRRPRPAGGDLRNSRRLRAAGKIIASACSDMILIKG